MGPLQKIRYKMPDVSHVTSTTCMRTSERLLRNTLSIWRMVTEPWVGQQTAVPPSSVLACNALTQQKLVWLQRCSIRRILDTYPRCCNAQLVLHEHVARVQIRSCTVHQLTSGTCAYSCYQAHATSKHLPSNLPADRTLHLHLQGYPPVLACSVSSTRRLASAISSRHKSRTQALEECLQTHYQMLSNGM